MITHGTVRVTTMISDSRSAQSFSGSSTDQFDDEDDNYEEAHHGSHCSDYHDEFTSEFSPPVTIDSKEGRGTEEISLSNAAGSNKGGGRDALVDSLGMVFLPLAGALAQEQETADDIPLKGDNHPPGVRVVDPDAGKRPPPSAAEELLRGKAEPRDAGEVVGIDTDTAGWAGKGDSNAVLSGCSSHPDMLEPNDHPDIPEPNDRERIWSGVDTPPTERVLTRLYEGHCFGEMALIYDEPRNATVQATTYTTCVYLHKDAFRKYLCDKTFNKLIEQAALKNAYFREQREMSLEHPSEETPVASATSGIGSWKCFASARALATVRGCARSSFRCTEQLKFAGSANGETNGRLVNDYRVCEKLGEGSFGAVYKVVHIHSGEVNAMKVCIRSPRHICCH